MNSEALLEQFLENVSKDKFRSHANKLLNECFILKECQDTKSCYYFVLKEKELFKAYFNLLGYEINIQEDMGIISLNNQFGTGRIRFRKIDSIILLIIRLLYIEEKKKLSQTDAVITQIDEIYDRYRSLTNVRLKKHEIKGSLGILRRYHIINNLDSDMGDPETRIQIYPSVTLALDSSELNYIYEQSKEKLNKYVNGGGANESPEENEDEDE